MIVFETYLPKIVSDYFNKKKKHLSAFKKMNNLLKNSCGVNDFFTTQEEATNLLHKIIENQSIAVELDRREYGDYQTNENLASKVSKYAFSKMKGIEFLLEPTCGNGNFILASLEQGKKLKKIVGIEIYQPYVWETKFKILAYYLENKKSQKPEIDIIHGDAFIFKFDVLAETTKNYKTLIIGNPPWVTNSELGSIDSKNLPEKSNFKKHNGFDAITGKGNFDIGEFISITILNSFQSHKGIFAFLVKNSVIKNIIQDQKRNLYRIGNVEKLNIDSKKEFNVSVNASLLLTHLNDNPEFTCKEYDFYDRGHITTFGWYKDKFVSSIEDYDKSSIIDGKSEFIWRSGVKHDCSKIMEIVKLNGHYKNGFKEEISLEKDLVYGLLKSSDLKGGVNNKYRKLTIITQKKIGQSTGYIKEKYPLTFKYLKSKKEYFDKRKSSIYKGKPDFSIFGIGEYSFKPYKVAISGMYKSINFTLVKPERNKPIMLDDTCYFIGFNKLKNAKIAHCLLNSNIAQQFLKSIIFTDSKRSINKDILMRINFNKLIEVTGINYVKELMSDLTLNDWEEFQKLSTPTNLERQTSLF